MLKVVLFACSHLSFSSRFCFVLFPRSWSSSLLLSQAERAFIVFNLPGKVLGRGGKEEAPTRCEAGLAVPNRKSADSVDVVPVKCVCVELLASSSIPCPAFCFVLFCFVLFCLGGMRRSRSVSATACPHLLPSQLVLLVAFTLHSSLAVERRLKVRGRVVVTR